MRASASVQGAIPDAIGMGIGMPNHPPSHGLETMLAAVVSVAEVTATGGFQACAQPDLLVQLPEGPPVAPYSCSSDQLRGSRARQKAVVPVWAQRSWPRHLARARAERGLSTAHPCTT